MKFIWNWLFKPKAVESPPVVEPALKKEPELIVGEPIISFVELVKSNPKRFKAKFGYNYEFNGQYSLTDTLTKETFWYTKHLLYQTGNSVKYGYKGSHSFVTQDEWNYIEQELQDFGTCCRDRATRLSELKLGRKNKRERQRLIGVYCTK